MRILSRRQFRRLRRSARGSAVPAVFAALILSSVMGVSNPGHTPESNSSLLPAATQIHEPAAQPSGKLSDPRVKKLARMAAEASGGKYSSSEILEKASQLQALGVRLKDLERYVPEKVRSSLKFRDLKQKAKGFARQVSSGGANSEKPVSIEAPLGMIEIGALAAVVVALLLASTRTRARS